VTLILAFATVVVLSSIAVACYRAAAEAAEQLCGCLDHAHHEPDVVVELSPPAVTAPTEARRERHLRVVGA
jgi:hypothetical protein